MLLQLFQALILIERYKCLCTENYKPKYITDFELLGTHNSPVLWVLVLVHVGFNMYDSLSPKNMNHQPKGSFKENIFCPAVRTYDQLYVEENFPKCTK